jgi:predicted nuclease of predicted toxin-antitoxin system
MKLLFDQNLSPKLVNRLADLFPGSSHVQSVGLDCGDDDPVWEHARLNGFAIVTKDED